MTQCKGDVVLFGLLKNRRRASGKVGLALHEDGFSVARARQEGDTTSVDVLGSVVCEPKERRRALNVFVSDNHLQNSTTTVVLGEGHYQLVQVEAPDVDTAELRAAVRWRIKDYLDYHVDDAIVDAFEVPHQVQRAGPNLMYAVAARAEEIRSVVDLVQSAGLIMEAVDIREMAMRNVAMHLPDQGGGVALVHLGESHGTVTISKDDVLYLTRSLEFGEQQLQNNPDAFRDTLALEIQRSLDFYESQLAGAPASRAFLSPLSQDMDAVLDAVGPQLSVPIYTLDFSYTATFANDAMLNDNKDKALYALGGAFRTEKRAL